VFHELPKKVVVTLNVFCHVDISCHQQQCVTSLTIFILRLENRFVITNLYLVRTYIISHVNIW